MLGAPGPNRGGGDDGGNGQAGFNGDGRRHAAELDQPTGVAVDGAGDLFMADTADCRVRVVPARSATIFGQAMTADHIYTVAGTGVCGTTGQGGPCLGPALEPGRRHHRRRRRPAGGRQRRPVGASGAARTGTYYGTTIGAGDIGVVVGGTGSYGPYLTDGLPATGPTAELNDPRCLAVGPTGALYVSDGFMHVIRVVPATSEMLLGRAMTGGISTRWPEPSRSRPPPDPGTAHGGCSHMGIPSGLVVAPSGAVSYPMPDSTRCG